MFSSLFLQSTMPGVPYPSAPSLPPDLCINILLGLPFLKHNKIVIDHDLHTAVHKPSSFDLLNENVFPKHCAPSKSSPYQHRVLFSRQQKEFLSELKITCTNRLTELERINYFERVTPYNVIAAIKDTISILASKQKLLDLESSIKKDFKPLFQPIPHVSELPTEVTEKSNLKMLTTLLKTVPTVALVSIRMPSQN